MIPRRPDWRLVALWAGALGLSFVTRTWTLIDDAARAQLPMGWGEALTLEGTSHAVIFALLPAIYWAHRRWPLMAGWRNAAIHALGSIVFCVAHVAAMVALRLALYPLIVGRAYQYGAALDRLLYEYGKDVVTYAILSAATMAFAQFLARREEAQPAPAPPRPPAQPLERFAVRKRGKEILLAVGDIAWIEAAGNYAVLHVGAQTYEVRSSLTKLESELDPRRFVRVHKSFMVNIARVREVEPWMSGDWRIRMDDGAEVSLSRRYRDRFEAVAPVKV
ncbi:MAG: LytTR family DNA-binding domain-containing protein [Reyranellaceae bacterium]